MSATTIHVTEALAAAFARLSAQLAHPELEGPRLCGYHATVTRSCFARHPHLTETDRARMRADIASQCRDCGAPKETR